MMLKLLRKFEIRFRMLIFYEKSPCFRDCKLGLQRNEAMELAWTPVPPQPFAYSFCFVFDTFRCGRRLQPRRGKWWNVNSVAKRTYLML
jgi:hypothetical protein